MNRTIVSVFGNPVEESDSLAVRLVPRLKKKFPYVDFQMVDPTENLEPSSDSWIILDVGMGIDKVILLENLDQLEYVGGHSVHDFDVYMELRLKEKLGELPELKIVIVPANMSMAHIFEEVVKILATLL